MRWVDCRHEKPEKHGQFYCWHRKYGKCVMGFVDGAWARDGDRPEYFLKDDTCPHQAPDGSFDRGGYEVLT